jgi:hypothetical protein
MSVNNCPVITGSCFSALKYYSLVYIKLIPVFQVSCYELNIAQVIVGCCLQEKAEDVTKISYSYFT